MTDFLFSGLNLAVATPFDEDGRIDYAVLENNLERYIEAGVDGFVLSSGTGMHVYLSRAESDELVTRASKIIDGRVKVVVQTSALLLDDVLDRTRHAKDSGADGIMVLPPFFEGPSDDDGVFDFYAAVGEGGLPIIGYNVPDAVGIGVTPDLLRRLAEIPNFAAVKDSSNDFAGMTDLIRTGVPVMNGMDCLVPYAAYAGVAGTIWGGANFAPRECVAVMDAIKREDWTQVRDLWRGLEEVMNLICQANFVESVYAAAAMTGYPVGSPRRPLRALSAERQTVLRAALGDLV
ncbi:dihydrodipicolinate synthase family protein [Gordonia sp. (in: high G+C Gram-positive bacteria)]|uniref:dihydrodipicolinate synthase family protein n=1 Tax=Gordonia sp. (in: high G+C Gram-positive bacteria) TaxID=84139 RepID=UPI00260AB38B|nr:dihydrodipicolinate synthase family protein [Gordonia sp. (in: high G+C Gram-positive bacteria)]